MGMFFDGQESEDVVQDRHRLLKTTNYLSVYIVDFGADGSMKEKELPSNYAVDGPDRRPIIIIPHDESI